MAAHLRTAASEARAAPLPGPTARPRSESLQAAAWWQTKKLAEIADEAEGQLAALRGREAETEDVTVTDVRNEAQGQRSPGNEVVRGQTPVLHRGTANAGAAINKFVPWAALIVSVTALVVSVVAFSTDRSPHGVCRQAADGMTTCVGSAVPPNKSCYPRESFRGVMYWKCP